MDELFKQVERVWKALLEYGPLDDGTPQGKELEDAIIDLRKASIPFKLRRSKRVKKRHNRNLRRG